MEPHERKDHAVLQQIRTIRNDKLAKRKVMRTTNALGFAVPAR
eukprot:SAG11_NODE_307_length_10982_cov_22.068823_5_plen_43_part_00